MDDKDNYFGGAQGVRASTETNFRMSFREAVGGNSQLARMQTQRPDKQIPEENESNESTNTILLIEIEGIRTYETTMYIIKHNTEILKFIFGTVDKVNKAVQSILMSADAYINYQIIHHKEDEQLNLTANTKKRDSLTMIQYLSNILNKSIYQQEQPPFNEIKFYEDFYTPEKLKDPIYKSEGLLYLDNNLPPLYVMLELNEEQFIVIEADNKKIRTVGYLREIKFIVVNEDQLNRILLINVQENIKQIRRAYALLYQEEWIYSRNRTEILKYRGTYLCFNLSQIATELKYIKNIHYQ